MKNQIMIIMLSAAFFATNSAFGMMEKDDHEKKASAAPISSQERDALLKKMKGIEKFITSASNHAVEELYKEILKEKNTETP